MVFMSYKRKLLEKGAERFSYQMPQCNGDLKCSLERPSVQGGRPTTVQMSGHSWLSSSKQRTVGALVSSATLRIGACRLQVFLLFDHFSEAGIIRKM